MHCTVFVELLPSCSPSQDRSSFFFEILVAGVRFCTKCRNSPGRAIPSCKNSPTATVGIRVVSQGRPWVMLNPSST